MRTLFIFSLLLASIGPTPAEAGVGKALIKGLSYLGQKLGKITGSRTVVRRAVGQTAKTSSKAAAKAATKTAAAGGSKLASQGAKAAVVAGMSTGKVVATHLGTAGTNALAKLSPSGGKKLAELSSQLARNPHKGEWLKLLTNSQVPEKVADFMWQKKGSIAVLSVATAMAMQPDEFLQAAEGVATTTVTVAGEHVMKPLISETAEHIAAPVATEVARQASASIPWGTIFTMVILTVTFTGAYWFIRRR